MKPSFRLIALLLALLLLLGVVHGAMHHDGGFCALCVTAALPELALPARCSIADLPDAGRIHPEAPLPAAREELAPSAGRGPPAGRI